MRPTSEPAERLLESLRCQPLLVVLRPQEPLQAAPHLERLRDLRLHHVEIAWNHHPCWSRQCQVLVGEFPELCLGAASVCCPQALAAAADAGLGYAVSPTLDDQLVAVAQATDFILVPGVMTPSEVHQARCWGCSIVKLFPAATLGLHYWRRLAAPLGEPLPFCIAAGGLDAADVMPWLEAGVDAVALGSRFTQSPSAFDGLESILHALGTSCRPAQP